MNRVSANAPVLWGAAQLAVTGIVSRALNLTVLVIVARTAPSEMLGHYVIGAAVGAFLFLASDLGLGQWLAREGAARPENLPDLLGRSRRLRVLIASVCLAALCVWIGTRIASGQEWVVLGGILASFVLQTFAYEFECLSRAQGRMHVELRSVLAGSSLTLAFIAVGPGLIGWASAIPLGFLGGSLVRLLVARALCRTAATGPIGSYSYGQLLCGAFPYFMTTMVAVAFVQVDIILIAALTSPSTAADYALVSRPLLAIGTVLAYAGNALIAPVSRAAVSNPPLAFRWLRPLALGAGVVGCVGTAAAVLGGPTLLSALYDGQVDSAALEMSRLGAIYLVFATWNAAMGAFVTSIGRQLWRAYATMAGLVAVVALTLLLVPWWPLAGAMTQFVVSEGVVAAFMSLAVLHSRPREIKDGRL